MASDQDLHFPLIWELLGTSSSILNLFILLNKYGSELWYLNILPLKHQEKLHLKMLSVYIVC